MVTVASVSLPEPQNAGILFIFSSASDSFYDFGAI